jgi:hypothetical protein
MPNRAKSAKFGSAKEVATVRSVGSGHTPASRRLQVRTAAERVQYIKDRMLDADRTERMWIHDTWRQSPIVKVPVDGLLINADNRRFRRLSRVS